MEELLQVGHAHFCNCHFACPRLASRRLLH
jgi:hypothetical protein